MMKNLTEAQIQRILREVKDLPRSERIERMILAGVPVSGGSPNTRLPFMPGNLNDCNAPAQTGMVEPITGLELGSGLVLGQFTNWTSSEVKAYTNTTVGTLYAGWYQWVQLDPNLNQSTSPLKKGQLLWWVQGGAYKHIVTNVEPADLSNLAGIYNNGPSTTSGLLGAPTSGNFFWMQAFDTGGEATVLLANPLTGIPAVGQSVFAAGKGAGAQNATCDVLDGGGNPTFTQTANMLNRFVGKAMALPVAGALLQISLPGRADVN